VELLERPFVFVGDDDGQLKNEFLINNHIGRLCGVAGCRGSVSLVPIDRYTARVSGSFGLYMAHIAHIKARMKFYGLDANSRA